MTLKDNIEDRFLDMTHEELKESNDIDWENMGPTEEEFRDDVADMHQTFEVYAGTILINKMFADGYITLGEYLELTDYIEEYERDLEMRL